MQMSTTVQDQETPATEPAPRPLMPALKRGLRLRCPKCGEGKMFRAYLKVNDYCPNCGEALYHQRADDAPPYVTIFIVAHVIGTMMVIWETFWPDSPIWLHMLIWPVLTVLLSLWLLPHIKGALVAYQWAFRMHGFDIPERENKAVDQHPPGESIEPSH